MRRMGRSLALISVVLLASCNRPALVPRIGPGPLSTTDLVRRSEIIVVGSITNFKFGERVDAQIPLFPDLDHCLIPVRVTVSVENSIKGNVPAGPLVYYYFGSVCGTMGPVESPSRHPRSIFFLRRERGSRTSHYSQVTRTA
jgi:hypothetical protein